jgi:tRNA(His) 5'-end guanylyltransferase
MDHAARGIMEEFSDVILAYGESDEYRQCSFFHGHQPTHEQYLS